MIIVILFGLVAIAILALLVAIFCDSRREAVVDLFLDNQGHIRMGNGVEAKLISLCERYGNHLVLTVKKPDDED